MTGLHKRFKDYSDLTALLRSRGMIVDDARAIPVLRREGYYMIINGYKDLFLDSAATQQSGGDRFFARYFVWRMCTRCSGLTVDCDLRLWTGLSALRPL